MAQASALYTPAAVAAKRRLDASFLKRGVITAVLSGMSYGLYTAFMTLAMGEGVWGFWYGENSGLSPFFEKGY